MCWWVLSQAFVYRRSGMKTILLLTACWGNGCKGIAFGSRQCLQAGFLVARVLLHRTKQPCISKCGLGRLDLLSKGAWLILQSDGKGMVVLSTTHPGKTIQHQKMRTLRTVFLSLSRPGYPAGSGLPSMDFIGEFVVEWTDSHRGRNHLFQDTGVMF